MFEYADKNKDGSLDKKEFLLFSHPEEQPEMFPLILQQTLDDKDLNKDGFIDFQEFIGEKGSLRKRKALSGSRVMCGITYLLNKFKFFFRKGTRQRLDCVRKS